MLETQLCELLGTSISRLSFMVFVKKTYDMVVNTQLLFPKSYGVFTTTRACRFLGFGVWTADLPGGGPV